MDGNRRWAKKHNLPSIEGHRAGVKALKNLVRLCHIHGIQYLTVYAFSTENWKREKNELDFLFKLLAEVAIKELASLKSENVKVKFIGDIDIFKNYNIYDALKKLEDETRSNTGTNLQIALNYGAISEIRLATEAIQNKLSQSEIDLLDTESFGEFLYTTNIPEPELLIRTGGEQRLSNYLLWQSARSQLSFVETLWPDFDESTLLNVIDLFQNGTAKTTSNQ